MNPLTVDDLIEKERECGVMHGPFWQAKFLERAPERIRRELELARRFPHLVATRRSEDTAGEVGQLFPPTSFTPVTAAADTNLWTPDVWTPIPAGDAAPGTVYKIVFGGIYSNRTTTTPASTWTARWGRSATPASNVSLGATGAVYTGSLLTNAPLYGEFTFALRSVGAAGTGTGNGYIVRGTGIVGAGIVIQPIGGTIATVDTTVAQGLSISHLWSAANASNTITVQWALIKFLN